MKESTINYLTYVVIFLLIVVFRPGQQLRQLLTGLQEQATTEQIK